jgi:Fe-S oxidoreductase
VVVYADCFTNYNEPHIGRAAVGVLESLGYRVELPSVGCCGRSMISTGLLPGAIATADRVLGQLREAIFDDGVAAIVVCEPSCLSAMKDDWLQLKLSTDIDLRRRLSKKAMLPEEFVESFWGRHPRNPPVAGAESRGKALAAAEALSASHAGSADETRVIFHGHCHQKALWGEQSSADAVRRFAGECLTVLPSGCCGMAGSFGYLARRYSLSMKIGELSVFPPIRADAGAIVLATGTSCRHQIRDGTGRTARHPIEFIAERLDRRP